MYFLFLFVVLGSLIVFLSKKRYFDFLTVYYLLLFLYNIPNMLGIVYIPSAGRMGEPGNYIYLVSIFPFIFCTIFLLLKQPIQNKSKLDYIRESFQDKKYNYLIFLLTLIFIGSILYSLKIATGSSSKQELLDDKSSLAILLSSFSSLAIMYAYLTDKKKLLIFFFSCMGLLFFFGGRGKLVAAVMCFLFVYFYNRPIVIKNNKWLVLGGSLGLITVILGKRLYGYVLYLGLVDGVQYWYKDFNSSFLITGSEFMTNSAILNAVIEYDFSIPWTDVFGSLLSILPIPVSLLGFNSGVFNEKFQSALFSDVNYGMAYSIWAEGYSWLGLPGVVIFSFVIPYTLFFLWKLYNNKADSIYAPLIILVGFTLAFWCHRNSVGTILASLRNIIYPAICLIWMSKFWYKLSRK